MKPWRLTSWSMQGVVYLKDTPAILWKPPIAACCKLNIATYEDKEKKRSIAAGWWKLLPLIWILQDTSKVHGECNIVAHLEAERKSLIRAWNYRIPELEIDLEPTIINKLKHEEEIEYGKCCRTPCREVQETYSKEKGGVLIMVWLRSTQHYRPSSSGSCLQAWIQNDCIGKVFELIE